MTIDAGAIFSDCQRYRYRLWRQWAAPNEDAVLFVMLNPSTADETTNDPTVERCARRALAWQFGRLEVVNLFALRSTDPKALYTDREPIGALNDAAIVDAAKGARLVICAWGVHGRLMKRGKAVVDMLRAHGIRPHALTLTRDGTPAHPLYLPYSLLPTPLP